jgi:hypothetical protein
MRSLLTCWMASLPSSCWTRLQRHPPAAGAKLIFFNEKTHVGWGGWERVGREASELHHSYSFLLLSLIVSSNDYA